ncbi:hypothetical protein PROFUN_07788 [Planoprotostelium fungivorum]|uniref:Uncharacterized protein n=1 Tax=Planoprotostelium fungivorum TaxID=1890364 RepID=A0A2P6MX87_9EUKA|nr:hypothetical protein PROFUN_07788 [Planoprotostelium fungivorum]
MRSSYVLAMRLQNRLKILKVMLSMKDFEESLTEVSASVSEDASSVSQLRRRNEIYGEGGNRKKESLPYYL